MAKRRREQKQRSGLHEVSASDLHRELRRRERVVKNLRARRAKLIAKIQDIEAQLGEHAAFAGGAAGAGRVRPRNEQNLIEALQGVIKGKSMSVGEAAEAVQQAGYRSSSPNFHRIVNIALTKKKFFKRVGRGRYTTA